LTSFWWLPVHGWAQRQATSSTGDLCQSERHQDVLLAFISSKIAAATNSDELDIPADSPQFQQSSLKVSSRCRLSRMTTLSTPLVRRRIGTLPKDLRPACGRILLELVGAAEP
jgi:hypothetical protein